MAAKQSRAEDVPALDVHGAFIRRTNLSNASLRGADLSRADATGASFRHADFAGACLKGTILKGADLTGAINLTEAQLADAIIDEETRLPAHIDKTRLLNLIGASRSQSEARS
jgi:uncharacterized protein YjbI with pentapeptide repeats